MSRFQCSAADLVRILTRQWAQAMDAPGEVARLAAVNPRPHEG
jgi:hypothetical protein